MDSMGNFVLMLYNEYEVTCQEVGAGGRLDCFLDSA